LSRKPEERIADIAHCCEKFLRYTDGLDQDRLAEDELKTDAVLRNIEFIGEATKNLPEEIRARMPVIDWKKIAGMRDIFSHAYYRVDPSIVWDVVENKIPELLRSIRLSQEQDQP
jgi:uncharacterized protein with HEPN domain